MSDHARPDHIITSYFAAMRRGPDAEAELIDLFAEDAVYEEPFSRRDEPAKGRDAIRDRFRQGWQNPLPDMELDVLSIEIDGNTATSRWECRSPAFPGPVRGTDHYTFSNGAIALLRVTLD